jgi:pimeloyl-ACP methyl ester carboxylesterase
MTIDIDFETWRRDGQTVALELDGRTWEVFAHVSRDGEWVTMLHGFPTSSLEWARVIPGIAESHRVLAPDFLGFGFSAKPDIAYSINLQADLVEALWRELGVGRTSLVAYDYGGMVALELLARRREADPGTNVDRVVLLNTAIFSDTYRPRLLTRLMASGPLSGLLGKAMNERTVTRSWSEVFSGEHPLDPAVATACWEVLEGGDPERPLRSLLHFVPERHANAQRWDDALHGSDVQLSLVWGPEDLVSGSDAALVADRLPNAGLAVLDGLGHAPHMEDPAAAGWAVRRALGSA